MFIEHRLFVDIDKHMPADHLPNAGALDLARLQDDIAIRQDNARAD